MAEALAKPESMPLQDIRLKDPDAALGVAIRLFMRYEHFARLPFGEWAGSLNGHIRRDHYRFILRGNEIVGYFGWCLTDEAQADRWLAGGGLSFEASVAGDCMVLNAWTADTPDVNDFILRTVRVIGRDVKFCYGRRYYSNGRMRPLKLHVQPWIAPKLARAKSAS